MSEPRLSIARDVIADLVRLAAFEVPGVARVGRAGPWWRRALAGPGVTVRFVDDRVLVRMWVVARPGHELAALTTRVRSAVAATVERVLGLELGAVTVQVDGVG